MSRTGFVWSTHRQNTFKVVEILGKCRKDGICQHISSCQKSHSIHERGVQFPPAPPHVEQEFKDVDSSSCSTSKHVHEIQKYPEQVAVLSTSKFEKDQEDVRGMLKRAVQCEKSGNFSQGITEVEVYLSKSNDVNHIMQLEDGKKLILTLANMYLKSGKYRRGIKWLEVLSSIAPDDPTIWQVWAIHEWKQGKYKSAKIKFEHGMTLGSAPHSSLLVAYASMEAQRRNRTKARALLRQAVKGGQNNSHAWVSWAQLEGRHGNFRKAIRLCKEGLRVHKDNVHLLCTMGQIYESHGDSLEAKNAWKEALCISPSNTFALNELGKLAWKNGDVEEASILFRQGVDSGDPKGALLSAESLANLYAFQGENHRVRKLFNEIYARYEISSSRFLRAWASFEKKTGNLAKASELFSESAQLNPRDERTWLQWALLEKRRNNIDKALDCVRAGVQVSPVNPFLWQLYGSLVWNSESPEKGREIFSRAIQTCPKNQQLLMEWAIMELRHGDQAKGLEVLRLADTSASKHIPILQLWSATAITLGLEEEGARVEALIKE